MDPLRHVTYRHMAFPSWGWPGGALLTSRGAKGQATGRWSKTQASFRSKSQILCQDVGLWFSIWSFWILRSVDATRPFLTCALRRIHDAFRHLWHPPGILEMIVPMPCWCLAPGRGPLADHLRTTCSAADDHGWPEFFTGYGIALSENYAGKAPNLMGNHHFP
jgi:hypothetical protein